MIERTDVMTEADDIEARFGGERGLVKWFRELTRLGHFDERLPMSAADKIVCEMSLKYGRADIVIFHADGSASVIEAKDGSKGYNHVVSGIGQAALYAVQIAMNKGAVKKVRKCLLWSSTGDIMLDAIIEIACEKSGTVPLPWQSMDSILATVAETSRALAQTI